MKGVLKTGDVIIPGDGDFPRFSDTDFHFQIDRMLEYLPEDDRDGLCLLMGFFAYTPKVFIKLLLLMTDLHDKVPWFLGAPLRMILIGVKGLIFTLYYSNLEDKNNYGQKIHDLIDWDTKIVMNEGDDMLDQVKDAKNLENPNQNEVEQIYKEAKGAQQELRRMTVHQRVNFVSNLREVILKRKESIIDHIQKDTGKSRSDALISEIFGVLDYLEFLENESVSSLKDEKIKTPIALMGKKSRVYYEPMGTLLIISPWNYPFYQAIVPIATSFVCGNATIYKPSEFTPLKGLVEEVLKAAGFKEEWAQVVYGDGQTGAALIDQRPDKIFFTGSVNTGRKVMEAAAKHIIPVELELGGKDATIVFDDADITRAAAGVAWGALTNLGQSCTSVERIYVQEGIYDAFKQEIHKVVKRIKQETDIDGDADVGAMTTEMQTQIVKEHLDDAVNKGATLLTGSDWDGTSAVIPPLLFDNVTSDMLVASEETFGPVLPLMKFYDEAEAINLANNSQYGLSASVWTADKERADRVTRALEVGNVSVNNVMLTEGNPYLPFGGCKLSGIGRYKGVHGLHGFCNMKSVIIDSNSSKIEPNWYPYTSKKYGIFSTLTDNAFTHGVMAFIKFALTGLKLESYSNKAGKQGR
jgi:acyl-CoA reductase-like NAD-dependent aldehyde dehydrogenase